VKARRQADGAYTISSRTGRTDDIESTLRASGFTKSSTPGRGEYAFTWKHADGARVDVVARGTSGHEEFTFYPAN